MKVRIFRNLSASGKNSEWKYSHNLTNSQWSTGHISKSPRRSALAVNPLWRARPVFQQHTQNLYTGWTADTVLQLERHLGQRGDVWLFQPINKCISGIAKTSCLVFLMLPGCSNNYNYKTKSFPVRQNLQNAKAKKYSICFWLSLIRKTPQSRI